MKEDWRNTGVDEETDRIDAAETALGPLDEDARHIRSLITSLESCHHKADRWVELIVEAIGAGRSDKGSGLRPPEKTEPIEEAWRHASVALSAWCAGCPPESLHLDIAGTPASRLLKLVGPRTALKEWQCQRIVDKFREFVTWPRIVEDASLGYVEMTEYAEGHRGHEEYTLYYEEHRDYLTATLERVIHDTVDGVNAEIGLATAIDHLQPCNWNFLKNLKIVLAAIGGDLHPSTPFACHGRNICLNPIREKMKTVCNSLQAFRDATETANHKVDESIRAALGERTPVKEWLAISLEKTLRMQLKL